MKFIFIGLLISFSARADICYYGKDLKYPQYNYSYADAARSGDNISTFTNWCRESKLQKYWKDFGMQSRDWNNGFGFEDICNINKPLGRVFNSLRLMEVSYSHSLANDDILNSAYNFSKKRISSMKMKCKKDNGEILNGSYIKNGVIELYWPAIYNLSVVSRASTIIHEARHHNKKHNAGSKCDAGASCDSDWDYQGANMYQANYLMRYSILASNSNIFLRQEAAHMANSIILSRFRKTPSIYVRVPQETVKVTTTQTVTGRTSLGLAVSSASR